jgi:hypothetical protein
VDNCVLGTVLTTIASSIFGCLATRQYLVDLRLGSVSTEETDFSVLGFYSTPLSVSWFV